jgi:hypothetical protein
VACICNPNYKESSDQEEFRSQPGQIVIETLSRKKPSHTKKGLVTWLKVKALSSSPSTEKTKINILLQNL